MVLCNTKYQIFSSNGYRSRPVFSLKPLLGAGIHHFDKGRGAQLDLDKWQNDCTDEHFTAGFDLHFQMFRLLLLLPTLLLLGCANKYQSRRSLYKFQSRDGKPDYANLDYWAAHPWKPDPSDSIPVPLRGSLADSSVDVFFLHPTTYTKPLEEGQGLNASIDDSYINAKTDYSTILYQASVFNRSCRVFAPRYRQAHISNFFADPPTKAEPVFELAYEDLRQAFIYYLEHWNKGRPIIIAGHSQGSRLAQRLIKEFFDDKPLAEKLVVAYIPGWPLTPGYFERLSICTDSLQTGCICSWRTFRDGYLPNYVINEKGSSLVTNPLTWSTQQDYVSRKWNKGSVLLKFNKLYTHTAGGQIEDGVLYIDRPKFPWSFLYRSRNYHVADINLFYLNIRQNIIQRIRAYHH